MKKKSPPIIGLYATYEQQKEEQKREEKLRKKHRIDDPNVKVVPRTVVFLLKYLKSSVITLIILGVVFLATTGAVSLLIPETKKILIMQLEQTISEVRMLIGG